MWKDQSIMETISERYPHLQANVVHATIFILVQEILNGTLITKRIKQLREEKELQNVGICQKISIN